MSERQREILELVARGCGNEEIALSLHVSQSTVKREVSLLRVRLSAGSRAELAAYAEHTGLPQP